MKKPQQPEEHPLWRELSELAEYFYSKVQEMPSEEHWRSGSKIRSAVGDLLFYAAQAIANVPPASAQFEWAMARKQAVALKLLYQFVCKQGFIELESSTMARLNKAIEQIDADIAQAADDLKMQEENDLKPWLKKYEIWKKISEERHA